ncbi:hypothetical protein QYE76_043042 [Lolium multiflorum]|uniref:CCHC-type domain-containing protein n=1 Tax=Lolium multiflorum TaxID=4521 RepID=A0AAD8TGH1_LOLMU|nr:hypothetical protein QYE76_043042 [Lolium multiflorum]
MRSPAEFSTTTATTLSCCRDSEEDLLLPLPAGTGRRTSSSSTPLEAELQKRFEHHDPCEMICELKVIFESHAAVESYEASKQFFGCMMEEGSSVSEHVFAMSEHARKLSDLGIVIPNQLGIHRVLQSLPPSYKNFVMNYNMQNMNKELPELFSMVKSAEVEIQKEHQVLMVNKTTNFKKQGKPKKGNLKKGGKKAAAPPEKPKGGPKPNTDCYYCNGKGHWKRNCPKYLADLKSGLVKKKKGTSTKTQAMETKTLERELETMKMELQRPGRNFRPQDRNFRPDSSKMPPRCPPRGKASDRNFHPSSAQVPKLRKQHWMFCKEMDDFRTWPERNPAWPELPAPRTGTYDRNFAQMTGTSATANFSTTALFNM